MRNSRTLRCMSQERRSAIAASHSAEAGLATHSACTISSGPSGAARSSRSTGSSGATGPTGASGSPGAARSASPTGPQAKGRERGRSRGATRFARAADDGVTGKDLGAGAVLDAVPAVVDVVFVLIAAIGDRLAAILTGVSLAVRAGETFLGSVTEFVAVCSPAAAIGGKKEER